MPNRRGSLSPGLQREVGIQPDPMPQRIRPPGSGFTVEDALALLQELFEGAPGALSDVARAAAPRIEEAGPGGGGPLDPQSGVTLRPPRILEEMSDIYGEMLRNEAMRGQDINLPPHPLGAVGGAPGPVPPQPSPFSPVDPRQAQQDFASREQVDRWKRDFPGFAQTLMGRR
jgi:hypothetical protein